MNATPRKGSRVVSACMLEGIRRVAVSLGGLCLERDGDYCLCDSGKRDAMERLKPSVSFFVLQVFTGANLSLRIIGTAYLHVSLPCLCVIHLCVISHILGLNENVVSVSVSRSKVYSIAFSHEPNLIHVQLHNSGFEVFSPHQ
ncbi:hypothetical protein KP509_24G081300 [Ceratopteris richardii]|uniref:Uncharacterized protein n=1 Tax=Ceratopteris richardii TaxID=49495 RepID=A0A8T2RYA3_CERRI|nr:hypothetical protein KP509_24G081300 [Ceratopteris richardii]